MNVLNICSDDELGRDEEVDDEQESEGNQQSKMMCYIVIIVSKNYPCMFRASKLVSKKVDAQSLVIVAVYLLFFFSLALYLFKCVRLVLS